MSDKKGKSEYGHYDNLHTEYQELLHNMDHYLRLIGIYTDLGQLDKIKQTLAELQIEFAIKDQEIICADTFFNAILSEFRERAESKHVQTKIFVEAGFQLEFMKELDRIAVLGNLLDNALEAAKKCEQGKITIDLFMQNQGALAILRLENNYRELLVGEEGKLISTKQDDGLHGIGLENVKKIIKKYRGNIQQEYSDGRYKTTVIIPVGREGAID